MMQRQTLFLGVLIQLLSMFSLEYYNALLGIAGFLIGTVVVLVSVLQENINKISLMTLLVSLLGSVLLLLNVLFQDPVNYLLLALIFALMLLVLVAVPVKRRKKVIKVKVKKPEEDDPGVYITQNSKSFHKIDCLCLSRTKREELIYMPRSKALKMGYRPCKLCKP